MDIELSYCVFVFSTSKLLFRWHRIYLLEEQQQLCTHCPVCGL